MKDQTSSKTFETLGFKPLPSLFLALLFAIGIGLLGVTQLRVSRVNDEISELRTQQRKVLIQTVRVCDEIEKRIVEAERNNPRNDDGGRFLAAPLSQLNELKNLQMEIAQVPQSGFSHEPDESQKRVPASQDE